MEQSALLLLDAALEADGGERIYLQHPALPGVIWAGHPTKPPADLVDSRAFDCLTAPLDPRRFRTILAYASERSRLLDRIRRLEATLGATSGAHEDGELRAIDRIEKRAIIDALQRANGNVRSAARLLGLGQATVYRKIKRYGIELPGRARREESAGLRHLPPRPARSDL